MLLLLGIYSISLVSPMALPIYVVRVPFFSILRQFHNSTFARNESMVWKAQSVRESFLQPFFQIKSIVTTTLSHHSHQ